MASHRPRRFGGKGSQRKIPRSLRRPHLKDRWPNQQANPRESPKSSS